MKVLVQRVRSAGVTVNGKTVGKIKEGLLLFIGIAHTDREKDIEFVAEKCINLRVFQDENGKMNRSVLEEKGEILAISQFTLMADTRKGRRPNFMAAASPETGEKLYHYFIQCIKQYGIHVESGIFGAMMDVELVNTGPVTLLIESK